MKAKVHSLAAIFFAIAAIAPNVRAENVKIAFMDPLSGPFASVGEHSLNVFQIIAEQANEKKWAGGHTIEFVGFDNKGNVQESLTLLQTIIEQGFRYIAQGTSSVVGLALIDAINKHNQRNPGKEIVLLNYGNTDPDLTNTKCSFWHFATAITMPMRLEALTNVIASEKTIKQAYLINQNYTTGQQASRLFKEYLARKRSDIQIVGDDFNQIGQVKDFSPYIAKIKRSGADTVLTTEWGVDFSLLVKAAKDSNLQANFYAVFAAATGGPLAMGPAWAGKVKAVAGWQPNDATFTGKPIMEAIKSRFKDDNHYYFVNDAYNMTTMFTQGIKAAQSTAPMKVALAMEKIKFAGLNGDPLEIRKDNHQLQTPLWVVEWAKADGNEVKYDQENTGYGWKALRKIPVEVSSSSTVCLMTRPL